MPKAKKIPLRMCIGCQEMKPKKELRRIVRTPENTVEIDLTGKRSGRGAYICLNEQCLERAIKGRNLERALHTTIGPEIIQALRENLVQSKS